MPNIAGTVFMTDASQGTHVSRSEGNPKKVTKARPVNLELILGAVY